ncbi:hypothetical protein JOQ06_003000 [Pogonophryne albipinna]|uniref:Ig-like domain-containing protein n=1 Tax=Pogonophryne albipinna TaxID=1090488 RepID=A0AAD6B8X9_9TELE|nr:hypothetical protein JOQ06_003000 [Pogonophryne albipinna]
MGIVDLVARWPGSTHDARILRESALQWEFEAGRVNGLLLGDSGYPLKRWLMTPVIAERTAQERRYNDKHTQTRNIVERCIGVLKRRNLSKNPMLTTLSWQIFEHLQLFELHLEEVVFTCGCEIRWLQLWQQRGEAGLSSQQLECDDGLKIKVLQVMNISSCDLPEISVSHSNLTVKEGDRVTAICNGSGSPLPEVDWPVNGLHSINAQEAKVYDNNTIHSINITLVNVSRDDNNFLLTCTATNIVGMTNASVQLTVHYPPTILKLLEPERRHDTCIEFTVRGWPHPTLQWFYKDKEISHTEYVRPDMDTYQDYIEGCLTFNVPTHHNNGNYTLVATNELGEAVSTIYGHFMDKPIVDNLSEDHKRQSGWLLAGLITKHM